MYFENIVASLCDADADTVAKGRARATCPWTVDEIAQRVDLAERSDEVARVVMRMMDVRDYIRYSNVARRLGRG